MSSRVCSVRPLRCVDLAQPSFSLPFRLLLVSSSCSEQLIVLFARTCSSLLCSDPASSSYDLRAACNSPKMISFGADLVVVCAIRHDELIGNFRNWRAKSYRVASPHVGVMVIASKNQTSLFFFCHEHTHMRLFNNFQPNLQSEHCPPIAGLDAAHPAAG